MLLSKDELEKLAVINPEIADYVAMNPRPQLDFSDVHAMRRGMDAMDKAHTAGLGPLPSSIAEFYHEIPMRDGFSSSLKVQRSTSGPPGPLLVLCFGGGFVGGSNNQFTKHGRALVKLFGATVVSIAYRLGPEYKFPYAQHDTWDSMKWIADNATGSILKSDPTAGFIMGGVSAGGALTAAFSRIFEEEPIAYPLTGQWLSIPSVMDEENAPDKYRPYYLAAEQTANSPFFSREARAWLKKFVQHDVMSPLRYAINSKTPLEKQPKTYFQVDGADPLRDDALIYDEMLKDAGVETRLDMYPGCPHGHFMSFIGLEITNRANIDTIVGIGWLLGKDVSRTEVARELDVSE